jgi:hypothetical protein
MDISKKEVAAISAAIAANLAKPNSKEETLPLSQVQKTLELLLEKVSRLEKRVDELSAAVNEIKRNVEGMEK